MSHIVGIRATTFFYLYLCRSKESAMSLSTERQLTKRLLPPRRTVRPSLEILEERLVLATDAPLTIQGLSIAPTQNAAFSGTLATFSDADPNGTLSQFSATINWGDGTTSSGPAVQIVADPHVPRQFDVMGTHTYSTPGNFNLTVTVMDSGGAQATTTFTNQTNLVSDLGTVGAAHTDSHLVNSWGIAHGPSSPWWVADNGTGLSTLYDSSGNPQSLVVTIPPPSNNPTGTAAPTGIVFNSTSDFVVGHGNNAAALFIFATEDGTISAWNGSAGTKAVLEVDNTNTDPNTSPVYKGLALASNGSGNFLYAANFRDATVDVFDTHFNKVTLPSGRFTDPNLPAGYAPFGIQNINGKIYVSYALQNSAKHDDVAGAGHGFIDVYDASGVLQQRLVSQGPLNSPWGMTLAPSNFGAFSNDLLVGNFGDGVINAFNPTTGAFLGPLVNAANTPISINGLWGLGFGNNATAGSANTLFFAAGLNDEADGLFGSLTETLGGQAVVTAAASPLPPPPPPSGPSAALTNQLVTDVLLAPAIKSAGAAAQQAFGMALTQALMQSVQQTQALVTDEVILIIDLVFSGVGIGSPSAINSLETAISNNPVYATPAGYATGLLAGALTLSALT
jgi:uncharacterized protein (TIGR03118 family)